MLAINQPERPELHTSEHETKDDDHRLLVVVLVLEAIYPEPTLPPASAGQAVAECWPTYIKTLLTP